MNRSNIQIKYPSDTEEQIKELPGASLRRKFKRERKESDISKLELAIARNLALSTPYIELRNAYRRDSLSSLNQALVETDNSKDLMLICRALGERGPKALIAVKRITRLLSHQDTKVKAAAAEALGNIGAASGEIVENLISLGLHSSNTGQHLLHSVCTNALAKLAENSPRSILTRIWKIASREEEYAQAWAACCLAIIANRRSSLLKPTIERFSNSRIASLRGIARTISPLCRN